MNAFRPYLAFRHFFARGYSLELNPDRLAPLVQEARYVSASVQKAVQLRAGETASK